MDFATRRCLNGFLGALLDKRPRQAVREAIVNDSFWNTYAIREGDWKLILSQTSGGVASDKIPYDPEKPPGQLYHLGRNVSESVNEYNNHPQIVATLKKLLKTYQESGRSAPTDRTIRKGQ